MKNSAKFLFLLFLLAISIQIIGQEAQDTTVMWKITTNDGNSYFGRIVQEDTVFMSLSTETLGTLVIRKSEIKAMDRILPTDIKEGKFWYPNLQSTRYFFSPNAYGLKKGEAYYQNIWIMFNQVSIGVIDNVSIGAGIVPLFMFAGGPTPVWVIPKVSLPIVKDKFAMGAGALVGTVLGAEESGFGIVYGLATIGSRNTNLTAGLGYGYLSGDWAKRPVITLSAFSRLSPRSYLITENYLISGDETIVLLSLGGRSIINRIGIDYGLVIPIFNEMESFIAFPWLGITVPMHKPKIDRR